VNNDTLPPITRCSKCKLPIQEAAPDKRPGLVCVKCLDFDKRHICDTCGRAKSAYGFCLSCYHSPE
jgi:hypothetical protein